MATLTGQKVKDTYLTLLRLSSATIGADASAKYIHDAGDTASALSISTTRVGIGVADPAHPLEVKGGADAGILITASDGSSRFILQPDGGGDAQALMYNNSSQLKVKFSADGSSYFTGGSVGIGTASPSSKLNIVYAAQTSFLDRGMLSESYGTPAHFKGYAVATADGTEASPTGLAVGEQIGGLNFLGYDGSKWRIPAMIKSEVTGVSDDTNMAAEIQFYTGTATGDAVAGSSTGLTKRMTIDEDGNTDHNANYIVNEQGRQNHVANTMSSPYYRFDGTDDLVTVADSAQLDYGTLKGSVEVLFYSDDGARGGLLTRRVDGSNEFRVEVSATGKIVCDIWTKSIGVTTTDSIVAGKWYHLIWAFDGGVSNNVYLNGVDQSLSRNNTASGSLDFTADLKIGYGINESFGGSISKVTLFNNALTATEVKELYSGASVPFKYKGANQTEMILAENSAANDNTFASDTGNWTDGGSWDINSTSAGKAYVAGDGNNNQLSYSLTAVAGKQYRVTFTVSSSSISVSNFQLRGNLVDVNYATSDAGANLNADGTHSVTFTSLLTSTDTIIFYLKSNQSSGSLLLDDVSVYPIGAVAEYDGSGIASDKWFDKSGNDLHGTITAGATAPSVENAPSGDDGLVYEEGTWTPVISDISNNAATLSTANGSYTRIGRFVMVAYQVIISSKGSMTGNYVHLKGMPYDHPTTAYNGTGMVDAWANFDTNYANLAWDSSSTGDRFWLTAVAAGGAAGHLYVPTGAIGGNESFKGAVIYQLL